ncbi:MAG: HTH domain-containing protein [Cetobacterium sp.]
MNKSFGYLLYDKINYALETKKISKKDLAKELGISQTALSNRFKKLKATGDIDVATIRCTERLTSINFFNLSYTENSTKLD